MEQPIRVNFSVPMPLFPLPDTVLLPHAVQPLHIFEPRYRQMITHVIDRSGQIAMATIARERATSETGPVRLRPVVCVGQIVQHERLDDGRYNVLLHGVCRARIERMHEADDQRAYRMAMVRPLEVVDEPPAPMPELRDELRRLLRRDRLQKLRGVDAVLGWFDRDDVTTHALIELIGFALVYDTELRYRLLAEPCPTRRAALIRDELRHLERVIGQAQLQESIAWPKGMSWN